MQLPANPLTFCHGRGIDAVTVTRQILTHDRPHPADLLVLTADLRKSTAAVTQPELIIAVSHVHQPPELPQVIGETSKRL